MTAPAAGGSREGRSFLAVWGAWILLALVLVVALAIGTSTSSRPTTNADRLLAISRTIKCPVCSGESVAESSAAVSDEIRADVAKRLEAGQTDDQIRQAYADQYGDYILLTPRSTGVSSLVWIIPVVAGVLALAGLVAAFQRWRVRGQVHATDADRSLVDLALRDEEDAEMGSGR